LYSFSRSAFLSLWDCWREKSKIELSKELNWIHWQSEAFHKSEVHIALWLICENGASIGSRKVQASVLGRSVRWENQHYHSLHVRQIRQHVSGFLLSDPIVLLLFIAQSFSILYKIKRSRFYFGMGYDHYSWERIGDIYRI